MSMLSAQCDELRELAGDGSMEWVAGPIRASMLREAADTIWELRCKLSDMVDERERARVAEAENAKLRELCRDMWDFFCVVPDEPHAFKEELDFSVEVWRRMRELGVDE